MPSTPGSSGLKISVSGVRGIVGRSLTEELITDFTTAFFRLVNGKKVLVAQDTRPSGYRFRRIILQTLRTLGCPVVDLGICPTPTALFMVRILKARGGIMITASHNPSGWNGLKFIGKDGQFLDEKEMQHLLRLRSPKSFSLKHRRKKGSFLRDQTALSSHRAHLLRHLNVRKIRSRHFRVAMDPCNGTGAVASAAFLKKLGCRVAAINDKPTGHFVHPPEPREENLTQLSRSVRRFRADIGFAQDPDADRLAIVTEKGKPLSGEYTLALAVQWILSRKKTPVVVNLSTSRMIRTLAQKRGVKLYYSKIGERHVVEKMRRVKAAIGGEGNGGVIYPKMNPARDSFVGMGLVLEYLASSRKSLSQLIDTLPRYTMLQRKLSLSPARTRYLLKTLPRHFPKGRINRLDGVRIDLKEGWVHVRPSNTEPIVRLIAEAPTRLAAERLLRRVIYTFQYFP